MDRHPNTCMGCDGAMAFNKEKLCGSVWTINGDLNALIESVVTG